jgi:hypothetical protein
MGIILDGSDGQPFELLVQRPPTATSEGEIVVVILPVFAAAFPQAIADIQVRLELEHAQQLAAQLQPAVRMAEVRSGRR